jgi:hypothetical protein
MRWFFVILRQRFEYSRTDYVCVVGIELLVVLCHDPADWLYQCRVQDLSAVALFTHKAVDDLQKSVSIEARQMVSSSLHPSH